MDSCQQSCKPWLRPKKDPLLSGSPTTPSLPRAQWEVLSAKWLPAHLEARRGDPQLHASRPRFCWYLCVPAVLPNLQLGLHPCASNSTPTAGHANLWTVPPPAIAPGHHTLCGSRGGGRTVAKMEMVLMRSCWPRALAEARASTRNAETVLCAYGSQIISSQNPQAVQCAQQLEDSSGGLSLVELATRNSKAQGSNRLSLSCWSVTSRKSENQSDSLTLCLSDKNRVVTNCISLQNDSPDSYAIFRSHPIFATCKREVSPVLPHIDQLLCEHASLAANQLPALSSSSEPLNPGPVVMTYWSQWGNGMMVNSLIILWYIMYIYIQYISLCVWIVIMDHSPIPYM